MNRELFLICAALSLGMPACLSIRAAEQHERQVDSRPEATSNAVNDAELQRLVLGTWEDNFQGKRTMTLKDDGTGTMVVELSGVKARLFASRLNFKMKWSVKDGRLKKQTVSGEPALQVRMILQTMGDRVDEPILELTEERLVLQDRDGKTKYTWRRVDVD